ncbi:T9SS type B sorting domain-containing protein [Luteibaculum oceani]|uniref:Gliding motility-associated C-terminal domain-containing protein n=1 Tax=Luteibaculum oceani TaxID=1294296 RepID=A0A5C6V2T8_9FLAO|nr:gliding motility-associated C-terminal domain-containing protein [Luteibaculum oceani]TXC78991.1 gliding motility-associated C-terminal domain-containing protein [Luteibaculum oceani]
MEPIKQNMLRCALAMWLAMICNMLWAQCGNISFEAGNFSGWKGQVGCVTDQISIDMSCPEARNGIDPQGGQNTQQGQHAILTKTFNNGKDPLVPMIAMRSPLAGGYIARLGDYRATTVIEAYARGASLEYEYQVTELNALITLYFAIVLQDPQDHAYGERPFFSVDIIDPDGNEVPCIQYVVAAQPGVPGFSKYQDYFYRDWTPVSINLQQYKGKTVKLKVLTSDCGQEAHLGYAYIDATCQEPKISSAKDVICPGEELTLNAPPGMKSYAWKRLEGGSFIIGTDENLVINTPGTYQCEMVPFSTSNSSCPFTLTKKIDPPRGTINPSLKIDPTEICQNDFIAVSNTSVVNGTTINYLEWQFEGNTIVNQSNFSRKGTVLGTNKVVMEITDADGCVYRDSSSYEVVPEPDPKIVPIGPFCSNDDPVPVNVSPSGGVLSGPGLTGSAPNYFFDPKLAGWESSPHSLTYSVTNVCTRSFSSEVRVNRQKDPTLDEVPTLCNDDPVYQLTAVDAGGSWTGPGVSGNGSFNPQVAGPGTHTISYGFGNPCPASDMVDITVVRRKNPDVQQPGNFCLTDPPFQLVAVEKGGSWSGPGINPTTGVFNPSQAGIGEHIIVHSFAGVCPSEKVLKLRVINKANADFTAPSEMCENDGEVTLSTVSASGTFSGNGIFSGNKFSPQIAGPGEHEITYLIKGNCGDTVKKIITVHPYFNPTISPVSVVCSDRGAFNLSASSSGGTWVGPGIIDSQNGTFNPANAGVGQHQIIYRFDGKCPSADTIQIEVRRRKNANFTLPTKVCSEDDPLVLVANEAGGVWSGPGVSNGKFDPQVAGVGTHTISYNLDGLCGDFQSRTITVFQQNDAQIIGPQTVCILEDPVQMQSKNSGGVWSGTGVSNSGVFDPKLAGEGEHPLYYEFQNNCPDKDTILVRVTSKLDASIQPIEMLCNDTGLISLSAVDVGGVWSGDGIVNAQNGILDPALVTGDTAHIKYTIGGLCGDTGQIAIPIFQRVDASIKNSPGSYCFGAPNDTLSTNSGGGVWSGMAVDNNGVLEVQSLAPNLYTVYYEIDAACPDKDSLKFRVLEPVSLFNFQIDSAKCFKTCDGQALFQATGGTDLGFSYLLDSTLSSSSGNFPALCTGTYRLDISDNLGCTFDTLFFIGEPDSLYATYQIESEKCNQQNGGALINNIIGGTAPYSVSWSDGSSGNQNLNLSTGNHSFTLTDAKGCTFSASFFVPEIQGPTLHFSVDSVSCFGFSDGVIYIDSITGGTGPFQVQGPTTFQNNQFQGLKAGNYSIQAEDVDGCIASAQVMVAEPSKVEAVSNLDFDFCDGQTFAFFPAVTGGNGAPYQVEFPDFGVINDTLRTDSSLSSYFWIYDSKGCRSDSTLFRLNKLPALEVEISGNSKLCPNTSDSYLASAGGGIPNDYQFIWLDSIVANPLNFQFDNSGKDFKLFVRLEDKCSTPAFDTLDISFFEPAQAGFNLSPSPTKGCEPLIAILTDTSVNTTSSLFFLNGSPTKAGELKLWNGNYSIKQSVVSPDGCKDEIDSTNAIEVYPIPRLSLSLDPEIPTELNGPYQFFYNSSTPISRQNWILYNQENGDTIAVSATDILTYNLDLMPGYFGVKVAVESNFGCPAQLSTTFEVIPETRLFVPNAFTPENKDGKNDVFLILGENLDRETLYLEIFNRWGEVVYKSHDPLANPWDGTLLDTGQELPGGIYGWRLIISDPIELKKVRTGSVHLIR